MAPDLCFRHGDAGRRNPLVCRRADPRSAQPNPFGGQADPAPPEKPRLPLLYFCDVHLVFRHRRLCPLSQCLPENHFRHHLHASFHHPTDGNVQQCCRQLYRRAPDQPDGPAHLWPGHGAGRTGLLGRVVFSRWRSHGNASGSWNRSPTGHDPLHQLTDR